MNFKLVQKEIARFLNTIGLKHYSHLLWIDLANRERVDNFISSPEFKKASHGLELEDAAYFLFYASFGDKWLIASFLESFFDAYPKVRIVASELDREFLRIFVGSQRLGANFIFLSQETIVKFSDNIIPGSAITDPIFINPKSQSQTDDLLLQGFPPGILRHMHLVKYPYFSDLLLEHGVSYAALQKMILYLPSAVKSKRPAHFCDSDFVLVEEIFPFSSRKNDNKIVLFNIYNITHLGLTYEQIEKILRIFESREIEVCVNVTNYPFQDRIKNIIAPFSGVYLVEIPGHVYSLFSQRVDGVFGVMGGAMNATVQFSDTHCLSLHASSESFKKNFYTIFGGKFSDSKENVWKYYDQDWPSLFPDRFIENIDIGNPSDFPDEELTQLVFRFCDEISSKNTSHSKDKIPRIV